MIQETILEVVVGSTAHGTNVKDGLEDLDLMEIVLEDPYDFVGFGAHDVWVSRTKPEGVRSEAGDTDRVTYGLKKYLGLALRGNPTVLLALFVKGASVRKITSIGDELRALAPQIVSKKVYDPFRGYMRQQHERLLGLRGQRNVTRPELVEKYGYDTKYAGHIVRLGMQGEEILLTGKITLPMPEPQRQEVIDTRLGKYSLAEISQRLIDAETRIDSAFAKSTLRDVACWDEVEKWMVETYLKHWRD